MNTEQNILRYLDKHTAAKGTELADYLGISRQAIHKHLKALIQAGMITKEGVTRGSLYSIKLSDEGIQPPRSWKRSYKLGDLEEDKVFSDAVLFLNLKKILGIRAFEITNYAFTEMLNNAIDHSHSTRCSVEISIDEYNLSFKVRDFGIGIFYSIFKKYALADEYAAIGELIKGKTTTMKERHSGEGIFFTSKIADNVSYRSHRTELIFDNSIKDVFVREGKYIKGSEVNFSISRKTRRNISDVFSCYAPEEYDYEFNKTRVVIKLFKRDYISRSEAKRMVSRLDKFKEIILDFKGVHTIGQGFADEVFRVFQKKHPEIIIKTENLLPALEPMIKHSVDNKKQE